MNYCGDEKIYPILTLYIIEIDLLLKKCVIIMPLLKMCHRLSTNISFDQ